MERTAIRPPIMFTRVLQIDRPRPVPPYLRLTDTSACSKRWNSRAAVARSNPTPVSLMAMRRPWGPDRALMRMQPRSVNFTALLSRLDTTWLIRLRSPSYSPTASSRTTSSR